MKSSWIVKGVIGVIVFGALIGSLVMFLWNSLMPDLFGMHIISFWQALGLLVLAKIFFHSGGRWGSHGFWKYRMNKKWDKMTPEERDKFRLHWEEKCKS